MAKHFLKTKIFHGDEIEDNEHLKLIVILSLILLGTIIFGLSVWNSNKNYDTQPQMGSVKSTAQIRNEIISTRAETAANPEMIKIITSQKAKTAASPEKIKEILNN